MRTALPFPWSSTAWGSYTHCNTRYTVCYVGALKSKVLWFCAITLHDYHMLEWQCEILEEQTSSERHTMSVVGRRPCFRNVLYVLQLALVHLLLRGGPLKHVWLYSYGCDLACRASHLSTSRHASSLLRLWMEMMWLMSSCFMSHCFQFQPCRYSTRGAQHKSTLNRQHYQIWSIWWEG